MQRSSFCMDIFFEAYCRLSGHDGFEHANHLQCVGRAKWLECLFGPSIPCVPMSLPLFQFEVRVSAGAVLLSEARSIGAGLGVVVSDILLLMFLK